MKRKLLEDILQPDLGVLDSLEVLMVHVKELDRLGHHFSDNVSIILWLIRNEFDYLIENLALRLFREARSEERGWSKDVNKGSRICDAILISLIPFEDRQR